MRTILKTSYDSIPKIEAPLCSTVSKKILLWKFSAYTRPVEKRNTIRCDYLKNSALYALNQQDVCAHMSCFNHFHVIADSIFDWFYYHSKWTRWTRSLFSNEPICKTLLLWFYTTFLPALDGSINKPMASAWIHIFISICIDRLHANMWYITLFSTVEVETWQDCFG